jgi:hypothetical protein
MLTLTQPPIRAVGMTNKSPAQLRALAASGASGLARAAQAEINRRTTQALRGSNQQIAPLCN